MSKSALILIIDDTPANFQIVSTILRRAHYQVVVASGGMEGIELADKHKPDLILLDIMMPVLDGYETCEKLKHNPVSKNIPIIFLTSRADPEDIAKGFRLGAVDYVTKPFHAPELLARVNTHLALKAKEKAISVLNQENEALLHVLCHDLVNPLSYIQGVLEITDADDFEEVKPPLMNVTHSSLKMISLVREMRALETGTLKLHEVNLLQALNNTCNMLHQRLVDKQVDVQINLDATWCVHAEATSLVHSVLSNLLTNAIKFSYPKSVITIDGKLMGTEIQLLIQDTGIGMPVELLAKLFNIGETTTRPGTQGENGTGFGMALVKKFMHAYTGDITVVSTSEHDNPHQHGTQITLYFQGCFLDT